MTVNPASVQPVEATAARLLARPILQEYDAFTVDELVDWERDIPPNRMVMQQCDTFKSIHDIFLVIVKINQPVSCQTSGRGDAELTALNIAAAESRPNRFCVRRTSG